jgi:hypothetical protein
VRVISVFQGDMDTRFFEKYKPEMDTGAFMDPVDVV